MSGQQPPYGGQPPQPGPPSYGQQPPQARPSGPPQGPPPGWQQLPGPAEPAGPTSPRRYKVAIAVLSALVLVLGALSAYLWFADDTPSAQNASTESVDLPEEIGDYTEQEPDSDSDSAIDIDQTREDYKEIVGAGFDLKEYQLTDGNDDTPTISVAVVRADMPVTPGYATKTSSTEVVDDDTICRLAYYKGYDPDAEDDEDSEEEDKTQRPQSCSRSSDGLTVWVNTYVTSHDEGPSLDELVEFTDQAYDAAK